MRRPMIIAATAGAVLAAGLAAAPALGATDSPDPVPSTATCPLGGPFGAQNGPVDGTGRGPGAGVGAGAGMGYGNRYGSGRGQGAQADRGMGAGQRTGRWGAVADPLAGLEKGSLTDAQKTALAGMAEEEKLAHDVYVALAATSKDVRFTRIAAAESRHLAAVRALLSRYGVSDPTAGKADGDFASANRQQQYAEFVARGDDSLAAALAVGRDIERADIADLAKAAAGVAAPDVQTVYTRLSNASARHLRAFGGAP